MLNEKERLVGFIIFIWHELGVSENIPRNSHEEFLKFPLSGIRQAANDMVEASQDIQGEELEKLDAKLCERKLPTLTSMRQKGFNKLLQILSRNKIKDEEEWHLVRSFVDNLDNNELDESISMQAQKLLGKFER